MTKKKKKEKNVNSEEYTSVVQEAEMCDEMKQSYINYAMFAIRNRALPDVRDGLKPVNRRILHAMNELNLDPKGPYRKSARVVGDVLGKYHPHGDSSVYGAMVRMAQDFKNNLTLVDGHGNFGSIDGDSPASMRYTEAKLTPFSMTVLKELQYDVVDYKDNFDGTLKEPTVMPNKLPALLINGAEGIAVGMATKIPTHNPVEVIDAFIAYIDNQDISIDRLCEYIPAPDFPTGGIIVNADEFRNSFYYKGEGSLRIRSKYHIEDIGYGKKNIVITEVPFTLSSNKSVLFSKFIDMIKDKKLDECSDARDESNREGIRIVLEVKKGVNMDKLIKKLLAKTQMEDSESYNFLALNSKSEPITYNLKHYFEDVLSFQKEFYIRKYQQILATSESRKEILDGYVNAYEVIRTIVEVILHSKNRAVVKDVLMTGNADYLESTDIMKKHIKIAKSFNFTERQANSILARPLVSLVHLEIEGYLQELESVQDTINTCQSIITNDKELCKVIKKELRALKKMVAVERRTEVDNIDKVSYKETVRVEELLVLVDDLGYLKILDVHKNYNEENYKEYKFAKIVENTDSLRFFTNKGNYIQLKMLGLDKTKGKDRGKLLDTYIELTDDEKILTYDIHSEIIKKDLLVLTRNSYLKRMEGTVLDSNYTNIAFTKMKEGDSVVDVKLVDKDLYFDLKVKNSNGTTKTIDKNDIKFAQKSANGGLVFKNIESESMTVIPKSAPEIEDSQPIQDMFISFNDSGEIIIPN